MSRRAGKTEGERLHVEQAAARGRNTKSEPLWIACTVWVRYTDALGKTTVRSHECWNVDLFMRNRAVEAAQANEQFARENKRKRGRAKVERLTLAQYAKELRA